MQNAICYDKSGIIQGQESKECIEKGYSLWIDVVNPTESELTSLQQSFNLDKKAFETYKNKSKKPQIRVLAD
jgi:magnesium transporter